MSDISVEVLKTKLQLIRIEPVRRQPTVLSKGSRRRDRAWSPRRGDDPDRAKSLYDDRFAFSISALHPIAPRLVVGPDDVWDVGMGNERYDAVRPSPSGVSSEVNHGHCCGGQKCSFRSSS